MTSLTEDNAEMNILQHLDDLRKKLIICVLTLIIFSILCYLKSSDIIGLLKKPLGDVELVMITPLEGFITNVRAAVFGGIVLSTPIIFLQTILFISPALYKREKIVIYIAFPFILLLFFTGVFFGFQIILPMTFKYLLGFSGEHMQTMLSAERYCSFVILFTLGMGLVFEMPMVMLVLTKLGIINYKTLSKRRKIVILVIVILSAFFTPPDVISQMAVAIPLILLFELSLALLFVYYKIVNKKRDTYEA